MASIAFKKWAEVRLVNLDQIRAAHEALGGKLRGRRFNTLQVNQSYAMMVSSQFQGFCRDLHDECIWHFADSIQPAAFRTTIEQLLARDRKLDRGNPTPGNIGSDFHRFGISFWAEVKSRDQRAELWQTRIETLAKWRNAIAHQDFKSKELQGMTEIKLVDVSRWRSACQGLAKTFDGVMRDYLQALTSKAPW